jgi:hypothetical protein
VDLERDADGSAGDANYGRIAERADLTFLTANELLLGLDRDFIRDATR